MLSGLLFDPLLQGVVKEFGEPQVQSQVPRTIGELLQGSAQDLVQEIVHRHLAAVEDSLLLQHPQLAAGMVAQEPEVRAEQPEEVLRPPVLGLLLQQGTGRAQIGPVAGLALEEVVVPDPLLVPFDLRDECVRDAVQDDLRVLVVRLGRQRTGGQMYDGPALVPRAVRVPSVTADGQPDLLEVRSARDEELLQPRQFLLPVLLQACLDRVVNSAQDQLAAHHALLG